MTELLRRVGELWIVSATAPLETERQRRQFFKREDGARWQVDAPLPSRSLPGEDDD